MLVIFTLCLINYLKKTNLKDTSYSNINSNKDNMAVTTTAVVVKVNEKSLSAMGIDGVNSLFSVGFTEEGNIGFKQGQEILIYFDGSVAESYPAQINNPGKIEIIKEKSDTTIPDDVLRFYYSSRDNVNVNVSELTNKGISLTITDTNDLPYDYSNDKYVLYERVKNEDYTGVGYKIGEDTEHSTSGYTGTGSEYIWQEVEKVSDSAYTDILSKDTGDVTTSTSENGQIVNVQYNWTKLYGELNERTIYM